jgi:hypothetical protein
MVRHLRSILYALVLASAVWILCGAGFHADLTGRALDNGSGPETIGGPLLLLLAGAAYAILLFAPISPAGPLLVAFLFLGTGLFARFAPDTYANLWPADITKDGFDLSTPGHGLTLLLAVPLVCTALSARRWAAYEPPRLVFLGTLGRASGQARSYGLPVADEPTMVLPMSSASGMSAPEETTLLTAPFRDVGEATTRDVLKAPGEATVTILRPLADSDQTQALISTTASGLRAAGTPEGATTDLQALEANHPDRGRTTRIIPVNPATAEPAIAELATVEPATAQSATAEPATVELATGKPRKAEPTAGSATRKPVFTVADRSTVAGLERPADEAAEDTRSLTPPTREELSADETTRRLRTEP